jgi:predicted amidohydrolase
VSNKSISVGLVQHPCGASREANLRSSTDGIRVAAAGGATLVLLQELHATTYFCQTEDPACFDLAEPVPGPCTERFGALAAELGIVIVTSLFEKRAEGLYHNTAVVLDADGSIAGRYRKMHIPDDPGYYEKYYFTPGDLGFEPIDTAAGRLGVLVCWDQWYPEAARLMALAGAQLLLYPTAIGCRCWSATVPALRRIPRRRPAASASGVAARLSGHRGKSLHRRPPIRPRCWLQKSISAAAVNCGVCGPGFVTVESMPTRAC